MKKQSIRSQLVAKRTYNRPLDEAGTVFETWEQTIDRVINHQRWLWERAKGHNTNEDLVKLTPEEEDELEELRGLLLNYDVAVSGRTFWLGGTPISKEYEATQFNPLKKTEKFITKSGVKSFEDFNDGDCTTVITHAGNWKPAIVRRAGIRKMKRIFLNRTSHKTFVDSCVDHTWILETGERVVAKDLKSGDRLYMTPNMNFYDWDFDVAEIDEQMWWCYGFVYGDGSIVKSDAGIDVRSIVRLCGDKSKFLNRFIDRGFNHSYPPSCKDDPFVYIGRYKKTLPANTDDIRLIRAFIRGYLDADGNKKNRHGKTQFTGISTSNKDAADFINRWFPAVGLYILSGTYAETETNYGIRKATDFSISNAQRLFWVVDHVDDIDDEECWCLTVDDDHSFVLPNGIVSGNCAGVVNATVHDIVDSFHLLLLGCFSENTEIITKSGNKKISDVSVLDEVLSYNELTNQYVWKYPIFSGNTNSKEINKLELVFSDNSIIKCTEDHLFLTKNRGWVEAKNLNEKDDLRFYE